MLWCWVLGDFVFIMYWVGFDDWLVGNFFWVWVFFNGILEIGVIGVGDVGGYICIVINFVGEVIVWVELWVLVLFYGGNSSVEGGCFGFLDIVVFVCIVVEGEGMLEFDLVV